MSRSAARTSADAACCTACGRPLTCGSTDKLTGLLDRWAWDEAAEAITADLGRGTSVLLLLDLDYFKQVNDTFGHLAGDAVLKAAADVIRQAVRAGDLVGRYGGHGGDEFLVLLPDADHRRGTKIAQRMRERLSSAAIAIVATSGEHVLYTGLTATIGGAVHAAGDEPELADMVRRADAALLQAKRAGRDRVAINSRPLTCTHKNA
ncbi:MAG: hypothetical protein JWQ81_992 [Amycolatopsis sp.]|uniref:GGDEF domain-containing protein n=1 Tax=Amycolatopsis sp. TaxID=37632 RepID=UPI0026387526|nr:GGDEF domain-containing protein [Amycolatopsis sp.]MCU1680253.1 hypothetical protein [Amycolatopsis sp.]